ncbi:hypothetical protein [Clostridium luticellarii]|uniref:YqzN/YkzM domain-containing protein n=1 Tax=Clostridium luticellarii TaxID=1691940 RepID=A0A2T0BQ04_9CLOT|nr:hypothetical protein [Clostridium luticellarii]PRR85964.1 hypothetical protein CLLU_09920 [Clostridium luticellarii]
MADANKTDPEVKKNDTSIKNTPDSTTKSTDAKANTTMASSSTKTSTPIAPTPVVKMTIPQEVKYPIGDLIENSKALTGHSKEAAVGALFGYKEKELTKADFKKVIDDFLKRKVK